MAREIKLTIDGTEYDLTRIGTDKRFQNLPAVILGGEVFQGMAIPKQPSIGYEILEFKQNTGITDVWTKFHHGWCRSINGEPVTSPYTTTEAMLQNPLYFIFKVRRLSDKVEFCVDEISNLGRIVKFTIFNNEMIASFEGGLRSAHINNLEKVEQPIPLFTTEDGVLIYPNDTFYYIGDAFNICKTMSLHKTDFNSKRLKAFSTQSSAENYVIENKNSINYIDLYQNSSWYDGGGINERRVFNVAFIKMLIKSKIK